MQETRRHRFQWHRRSTVLPTDVQFHRWVLVFGQSSSDPIDQVLQDHSVHDFGCPLLFSQAVVPFPFQDEVGEITSESSPLNSGHLRWQFARCVTWRTVSWHGALQCLSPFPVSPAPGTALRISRPSLEEDSKHLLGFPL